jgi:NAD(P)-dependent dehydrogenase (short-subunit alcohol dehydrogenase family)
LLAVADINMEAVAETASLVKAAGGQVLALGADISAAEDVQAMLDSVVRHYGRLDHAFNNAGVAQWQVGAAGKKVAELTEEAWSRVIAINLTGTWLCMRAEIEHMRQHGGGTIVNTASISGLIGMVRSGAYVASKHAIVGLSKSAALDYAEANIRINCVCPGLVDTVFVQAAMADRGEQLMASVPMQRMAQPEEISEMVLWLMSDKSRYVTGGAFPIDGGVMAG